MKVRSLSSRVGFRLRKSLRDSSGATAIEYGIIAAMIAVVLMVALAATSKAINSKFGSVSQAVNSAGR